MEIEPLIPAIASFLSPLIPNLLKPKDHMAVGFGEKDPVPIEKDYMPDSIVLEKAERIWNVLLPKYNQSQSFKETINGLLNFPYDEDARAALRYNLKILAAHDKEFAKELTSAWVDVARSGIDVSLDMDLNSARWMDVLSHDDDVLKRIEMVRLLRIGMDPEQIARLFHTDINYINRVHGAFTLSGVHGIVSGSNIRHWLDKLSHDDPFLRRLEMVRLLRCGAYAHVIARQYNTTREYVYRLNERFEKNGYVGILTEDDIVAYRNINPKLIRICSFNLHGTHDSDDMRFRKIASELSIFDPQLCAYQEVISGAGISETSAQIASWMTKMTGSYYRTYYSYCHLYMETYPEGVAVSGCSELLNTNTIDLNDKLSGSLRPAMDRFAATCEFNIYGKRIIFSSLHLDHHENKDVRLAQAEKLVDEIERLYGKEDTYYCCILAGDFNDVEDSPVMEFLKKDGFVDAYRAIHPTGGNTFNSTDPFTRIDYIMIKGNIKKVHSAELILDNPQFSDHIGLYAVIE